MHVGQPSRPFRSSLASASFGSLASPPSPEHYELAPSCSPCGLPASPVQFSGSRGGLIARPLRCGQSFGRATDNVIGPLRTECRAIGLLLVSCLPPPSSLLVMVCLILRRAMRPSKLKVPFPLITWLSNTVACTVLWEHDQSGGHPSSLQPKLN